MANFAELEDVEYILLREITDPDEVASCEFALAVASNAIRDYTDQYIERVSDEEITINGPCNVSRILLPEIPVIEIDSVYEDGELLTADEDYKIDLTLGILHRTYQGGPRAWSAGIQNIVIVYTHGYDPLPDTIVGICARAASRQFQAALKSSETEGIPGVSSKSLGDFSVSFATDTSDGQMGASAARVLLMSEKDILDKYKAI